MATDFTQWSAEDRRQTIRQERLLNGEIVNKIKAEAEVTLLSLWEEGGAWQAYVAELRALHSAPTASQPGFTTRKVQERTGFLQRQREGLTPPPLTVPAEVLPPLPATPKAADTSLEAWRSSPVAKSLVESTVAAIKALGLDASDLLQPRREVVEKIVEREVEPAWKKFQPEGGFYIRPSWWGEANEILDEGENLLLVGPSGCGKSEGLAHIAKARGHSHYIVDCSAEASASVIVGSRGLQAGSDVYRPGKAVRALQDPAGAVLEFSELDFVPADILAKFHRILCPGRNGERCLDAPDAYEYGCEFKNVAKVLVVGGSNTIGRAPDRRYPGTRPFNLAFLDRWTALDVSYENESLILQKGFGLDVRTADRIETWAKEWRRKLDENGISAVWTTRSCIRVAKKVLGGKTLAKAIGQVLCKKLEPSELLKLGVPNGSLAELIA